MNKKEQLKKLVGYNNILRIKKALAVKKYISSCIKHKANRYQYDREIFCDCWEFKLAGKNVFFGYYDLKQLDASGERALAHIVRKNGNPANDSAELAWIGMRDKKLHVFARTKAWSWQQGARLRWHPTQENWVMFNDYDGKKYVTRIFDLKAEKIVETIPLALYDVDPACKYGLGLNYARLQRLRPGYGYSCYPDESEGVSAPESDGIYRWSRDTGEVKKIVSLKELADKVNVLGAEHYINHISISPTGDKFMFFHLWSFGIGTKWAMRLYICNIDGSNLTCIDDQEIISHYCWYRDELLLTTSLANDKVSHAQYIVYQLKNKKKNVIRSPRLEKDGHPTFINAGTSFVSDTYPLNDSLQYLFYSLLDGKEVRKLLEVYANPFLLDEHRCDLHPRIDEKYKYISVDTTYTGVRSILFLNYVGTFGN